MSASSYCILVLAALVLSPAACTAKDDLCAAVVHWPDACRAIAETGHYGSHQEMLVAGVKKTAKTLNEVVSALDKVSGASEGDIKACKKAYKDGAEAATEALECAENEKCDGMDLITEMEGVTSTIMVCEDEHFKGGLPPAVKDLVEPAHRLVSTCISLTRLTRDVLTFPGM